jgi:hypothetical protein
MAVDGQLLLLVHVLKPEQPPERLSREERAAGHIGLELKHGFDGSSYDLRGQLISSSDSRVSAVCVILRTCFLAYLDSELSDDHSTTSATGAATTRRSASPRARAASMIKTDRSDNKVAFS